MHSRVFCICEKGNEEYRENIECLTESEMYDYCKGVIPCFDYCSDNTEDKDEDFNWLRACNDFIIKTGENTFKIDEEKFETAIFDDIQALKNLADNTITIEDFKKNSYGMSKLINHDDGFYIYEDCGFLDSLESWALYIVDYDKEYEIVRTFDYHC